MLRLLLLFCVLAAPLSAQSPKLRFLAIDNGDNQLVHVDQTGSQPDWVVPLPKGCRDLQLLAGDRLLVSTGQGFEIRSLADGSRLEGNDSLRGVQSARHVGEAIRVAASHGGGVSLSWFDSQGVVNRSAQIPESPELRLVRDTPSGDLLLTTAKPYRVLRVSAEGTVLQTWPLRGKGYLAELADDGTLYATNGATCEVERFSPEGAPLSPLGGKQSHPGLDWFSGFSLLPDGRVVVANWQGHLPRDQRPGPHLIAYQPDGTVAWTWSDPKFAQITHVLVIAWGE